jgi:hypothetical protein
MAQTPSTLKKRTDLAKVLRTLTCGSDELKSPKADVIESLVVKYHTLVRILHQLMHRERRIVRLNDCVRHFRGRKNRKSKHHPVRVLLSDLRDQQCPHAGSGSTSQGMTYLKTCAIYNRAYSDR